LVNHEIDSAIVAWAMALADTGWFVCADQLVQALAVYDASDCLQNADVFACLDARCVRATRTVSSLATYHRFCLAHAELEH